MPQDENILKKYFDTEFDKKSYKKEIYRGNEDIFENINVAEINRPCKSISELMLNQNALEFAKSQQDTLSDYEINDVIQL